MGPENQTGEAEEAPIRAEAGKSQLGKEKNKRGALGGLSAVCYVRWQKPRDG